MKYFLLVRKAIGAICLANLGFLFLQAVLILLMETAKNELRADSQPWIISVLTAGWIVFSVICFVRMYRGNSTGWVVSLLSLIFWYSLGFLMGMDKWPNPLKIYSFDDLSARWALYGTPIFVALDLVIWFFLKWRMEPLKDWPGVDEYTA